MRSTEPESKQWLKRFLPIWIGQAFSLLGSGLVQFALVWWMTQTTGSATVLATATFVALLPEVVLGPFIGALVDRWNRKLVMMLADGSVAVLTALLGFLYWSGHIALWHIYALMFLRAVGGVFHFAALQASISLMVPDEHLARVAGINQSLRGALNIAAPPLGALLMTLVPLYGILAIDVTTALIAVSILFFVAVPQVKQAGEQARITLRVVLEDVRAGFRYVRGWPGMYALLIMATVLNFLSNPSFSFMPLLVTRHFNGTAWHLSAMESLFGIGVVLGGLILGAWGGFRKKIYTGLTGLVLMSSGMFLVAAAPSNAFGMALAGMSITGLMNPIVNGPIFAILQARVAPRCRAGCSHWWAASPPPCRRSPCWWPALGWSALGCIPGSGWRPSARWYWGPAHSSSRSSFISKTTTRFRRCRPNRLIVGISAGATGRSPLRCQASLSSPII